MVKITDVEKLQHDIENDPIIRDQMANLGFLLVCTFLKFSPACFSDYAYIEQLRSWR